MKASEVTKAMLDAFDENIDTSLDSEQKIIATAVNAVFGDPTPITAEWLVANGYVLDKVAYYREIEPGTRLGWACGDVAIVDMHGAVILPTKTIGQLRALEIGLGLRS